MPIFSFLYHYCFSKRSKACFIAVKKSLTSISGNQAFKNSCFCIASYCPVFAVGCDIPIDNSNDIRLDFTAIIVNALNDRPFRQSLPQ